MKVLLVENNEQERNRIKQLLETNGFAIDEAPDETEAIEYARSYDYNAGIVDLHLTIPPMQMEGLNLIRDIRRLRRQFPILVLTFRHEPETEIEVFEAGANDFVIKPLVPRVLLVRIYNMIRNLPEGGMIFEHGPIKLDITNAEVHFEGNRVNLTRKEFSLLRYLMMVGRAVSTEELINHLWDAKSNADANNVMNLVSRLRNKLDPQKRIDPIPHVGEIAGYRLKNF